MRYREATRSESRPPRRFAMQTNFLVTNPKPSQYHSSGTVKVRLSRRVKFVRKAVLDPETFCLDLAVVCLSQIHVRDIALPPGLVCAHRPTSPVHIMY